MKDANGIELNPGDRVRIHHEWQDAGDDDFEHIVVEVPEDSPRVLIKTSIPDFEHPPTEWIDSVKLILLDMH